MHDTSWRPRAFPRLTFKALSLAVGLTAISAAAHAEQARVTLAIQYGYAYLPVTVADKLGLFQQQAKAMVKRAPCSRSNASVARLPSTTR
ncbi:hypothetical protein [Pseudomonas sp. REB1044]|uniref:hypothetical protein n=1 Tax=Pseudomonas sp. REB1044 TaxID=2675224 RepID=UPI00315C67D9